MKLHPLILSTLDVQQIIAGNKVRHSVPVKPQPIDNTEVDGNFYQGNHKGYVKVDGHPNWRQRFAELFGPFGSPGDNEWQTGIMPQFGYYWVKNKSGEEEAVSIDRRGISFNAWAEWGKEFVGWKRMGSILYLREAWRLAGWDFEEGTMLVEYATGEKRSCEAYDPNEDSEWLMKQVDKLIDAGNITPYPTNDERYSFTEKKQPFNSPISMPREASRIYLEVTDVVCKRVQDITEEEAKAHGILKGTFRDGPNTEKREYHIEYIAYGGRCGSYKDGLKFEWYRKHGPDSWNNNDFVFSCNWKVLSTTGKPDYIK